MRDATQRLDRLRLMALVVLVLTTVSTVMHYALTQYLGRPYPSTTFLFRPLDRFNDFLNIYKYVGFFNAGSMRQSIAYTPFTHMLVTGIRAVLPADWANAVALATFVVVIAYAMWRFGTEAVDDRLERVQTVFILVALSYPVLTVVDRSNLETILFLLLAGFFCFYYVRPSPAAYFFLAAAISMKTFPATLLVLLMSDKKWRQAGLTLLGSVALTLACTRWLADISHHKWRYILQLFQKEMIGGQTWQLFFGVKHGHTLWGAFSVLSEPFTTAERALSFSGIYVLVVLTLFALVSFYVVRYETVTWRKVTLLLICAVLFPYISNDYTMIHLYFGLILFLRADTPRSRTYGVLFALLLAPLDFLMIGTPRWMMSIAGNDVSEVSTSVVLYPAVMTLIAALIVIDGLRERRAARLAETSTPSAEEDAW